ncbi:hypothetical protein QR680_000003 [Steinernema hermaphroditum]|uniref:Domain of unknown function DB domain-containing protein n=1 Tax=Steinernema hermaphroditum TaxID=289476 RepID=A0AA39LDA9_9BILA|nr:hypothetical protein QR680_000003 [Steinernema hermaphroditum]
MNVVAIFSVISFASFVLADLPSCERARCTHCESQFVARLCVETCRLCHTSDSSRPSVRGQPIAETNVIQSGLGNLHVISQQTNNPAPPVAPVAQQPPQASVPQAAQLPSIQSPQQIFQQAPPQQYYTQQVVQPQPQAQIAQPQQQFLVQPPQIQAPQPQFVQSQPYYPFQYQPSPFGAPVGTQQSFFFNPFQPFLPYSPASLALPGQTPLLPAPSVPSFGVVNATQPIQPSSIVVTGKPSGTVYGDGSGAGAGASAGVQQSIVPPSPPPPANLIDSQNYQYQNPAQSGVLPQTLQSSYTPTNSAPKVEAAGRPQQAFTSSNNQQKVNTVKSLEVTTPATKATSQSAPQCPRQPSWQPCISKDLANERFRSCCQRLGEGCVSLCSYDQNLATIQIAVLTGRCPISKVAAMMICASGYEDATPCCQAYGVFEPGFEHCKPYCNPAAGLPQGGMLTEQYKCLGKLSQIQHCFYVTQRP